MDTPISTETEIPLADVTDPLTDELDGKERRNRGNLPTNRGPLMVERMLMLLKAKGVLLVVPDTRSIKHVSKEVAEALFRGSFIRAEDVDEMDIYLRKRLTAVNSGQISAVIAHKEKEEDRLNALPVVKHG